MAHMLAIEIADHAASLITARRAAAMRGSGALSVPQFARTSQHDLRVDSQGAGHPAGESYSVGVIRSS
jgi:hypothetical protein